LRLRIAGRDLEPKSAVHLVRRQIGDPFALAVPLQRPFFKRIGLAIAEQQPRRVRSIYSRDFAGDGRSEVHRLADGHESVALWLVQPDWRPGGTTARAEWPEGRAGQRPELRRPQSPEHPHKGDAEEPGDPARPGGPPAADSRIEIRAGYVLRRPLPDRR